MEGQGTRKERGGDRRGARALLPLSSLPPYLATWLSGLMAIWLLNLAWEGNMPSLPLMLLLTAGTSLSFSLRRQVPPSPKFHLILGFLDAGIGLFALRNQPLLNGWLGISSSAPPEILIGSALIWYTVLRSFLLFSEGALLWQHVPVVALFGLMATWLSGPEVTFLFACYLVLLLYCLMFTHQASLSSTGPALADRLPPGLSPLEKPVGVNRDSPLLLRWAVHGAILIILGALVLVPVLHGLVGKHLMRLLLGIRLPASVTTSSPEAISEVEVGTGPVFLSEQPILRVRMEAPFYVRQESLEEYTGRGWRARRGGGYWQPAQNLPSAQQNILRSNRLNLFRPFHLRRHRHFFLPSTTSTRMIHQWVQVMNDLHRHFYMVGEPVELRAHFNWLGIYALAGTYLAPLYYGPGEEYEVISYLPSPSPSELREVEASYPEPILSRYLALPKRLPSLERVVQEQIRGQPTVYDRVLALKRYITRQCAYNLNVQAFPQERDVVEYFLLEGKEGYCDAFATALAVLCRYASIPARVARGFLPKVQDEKTGEYILRDMDRHLWTEVYFPGYGWVPFDATENARDITASTTPSNSARAGSEKSSGARQWLRMHWIELLIVLLALYLVWQELLPRLGWRGWSRRVFSLARPYYEFQRLLVIAGLPPAAPTMTPLEYWAHIRERLPTSLSGLIPLGEAFTLLFSRLRYAPEEVTPEKREQLREHLKRIKCELSRAIPWWRRLKGGLAWLWKWHTSN